MLFRSTDATLIVRPEDAHLVAPGHGFLDGVVSDVQFYGGSSTVAVDVPGHSEPVLVTSHGATQAARGSTVGVSWDAARAVVLGEDG